MCKAVFKEVNDWCYELLEPEDYSKYSIEYKREVKNEAKYAAVIYNFTIMPKEGSTIPDY